MSIYWINQSYAVCIKYILYILLKTIIIFYFECKDEKCMPLRDEVDVVGVTGGVSSRYGYSLPLAV